MVVAKPEDEASARIAAHIANFPEPQAAALSALRVALRRLAPGAIEAIAWGMPTLKVGPDQLVSYSGFARHNSLFPGPDVCGAIAREFPDVSTTKGTIHIDRDRPVALKLIRRIVKLRIAEINQSYPRAGGKTQRYFDNGYTEYTGAVREGVLHGTWRWFRRDGTIKRSGSFKHGEAVGEWVTYDASGKPYRTERKS